MEARSESHQDEQLGINTIDKVSDFLETAGAIEKVNRSIYGHARPNTKSKNNAVAHVQGKLDSQVLHMIPTPARSRRAPTVSCNAERADLAANAEQVVPPLDFARLPPEEPWRQPFSILPNLFPEATESTLSSERESCHSGRNVAEALPSARDEAVHPMAACSCRTAACADIAALRDSSRLSNPLARPSTKHSEQVQAPRGDACPRAPSPEPEPVAIPANGEADVLERIPDKPFIQAARHNGANVRLPRPSVQLRASFEVPGESVQLVTAEEGIAAGGARGSLWRAKLPNSAIAEAAVKEFNISEWVEPAPSPPMAPTEPIRVLVGLVGKDASADNGNFANTLDAGDPNQNPYIQALRAHREELLRTATDPRDFMESLASRLATQRHDALASLQTRKVLDVDEERLLRHVCLAEDCAQVDEAYCGLGEFEPARLAVLRCGPEPCLMRSGAAELEFASDRLP
jgi:hypothetical protein